jgi:hypothetical protein
VGDRPAFWFCYGYEETLQQLKRTLGALLALNYEDIVILTCATESTSIIKDDIVRKHFEIKGHKIPFTTCRKFKGLEADAIVIVDVGFRVLEGEKGNLFYVGASRAKFELGVIVSMGLMEQRELLENKFNIKLPYVGSKYADALSKAYNKNGDSLLLQKGSKKY